MRQEPRLQVIATGGTIAMRLEPAAGGVVPATRGVDLVGATPGLESIATGGVLVDEFANIPSERMHPSIWLQLAQRVRLVAGRGAAEGIVILHGTDTMEETAFYLDLVADSMIPIVLTGAQRAATDPNPDGPGNLRDAARVALHPQARGRGVMIVMDGEIHAARSATKMNTHDVDAFDSTRPPDMGWVSAGRVHFTGEIPLRIQLPFPTSVPRVDIIPMYAGADDAALRAALARDTAGLVIEAVGAGNVNQELYEGIRVALKAGVPVVISSRVLHGGVRPLYAYAGGGVSLVEAGAILSHDLTPPKARALLIAALGAGISGQALATLFRPPVQPLGAAADTCQN